METILLQIKNDLTELLKITATIENIAEEWSFPTKFALEINLVLEELVANIITYAYDDSDQHLITIAFSVNTPELTITMTDDGKAFNLLEYNDEQEVDKSIEERRIGGLGIHFVKTLMDHVTYQRTGNMNIVVLSKKYE